MALFDDWAARFGRGERPDLREYLARAGDAQGELAALADAWLSRIEPPEPDDDAIVVAVAWSEGVPPIAELRRRRDLTLDQVVDALVERFGLDNRKRGKVRAYYEEIESGKLVPADRGLVSALAELVRARGFDLLARRSLPPAPAAAQAAPFRAESALTAARLSTATPPEPDAIDVLFRSRP
jgi:hypothetical protein